jgi:rfaE bifunctional protein kinase chain/domain
MKGHRLTAPRLRGVIRRMQKLRILVIGDLMLDKFIYGKVSRISPEAPVPVVHVTHETAYPGGAANVARNLADFGIKSVVSGIIGPDTTGQSLAGLMKKSGIATSGIVRHRKHPTTVKTRVIARQQQVVRVDREVSEPVDAAHAALLLKQLRKVVPGVDAIIIEDYGKGLLTAPVVAEIIALGRKHKKIITVDPNPNNPQDWRGVTAVKPNKGEAFTVAGVPLSDDAKSLGKVGAILHQRWDCPHLLITLGEHGMMLFQKKGTPYHTPTRAQEVFDVSGAGDTAIAFFTAALAAGCPGPEAAEIANHAAGVVVGKLGTATLTPEELLASLDPDDAS